MVELFAEIADFDVILYFQFEERLFLGFGCLEFAEQLCVFDLQLLQHPLVFVGFLNTVCLPPHLIEEIALPQLPQFFLVFLDNLKFVLFSLIQPYFILFLIL
jgi:hypothetical protein